MKRFAELYTQLDKTTRTTEKVSALINYFKSTPAEDAIWTIALMSGKRPKRPIRSTDLRLWAGEMSSVPAWLFEESYEVVGDLAETIALLIAAKKNKSSDTQLHIVMKEILDITKKSEAEKKDWLYSYWQSLDKDELFVFNKFITGSLRVGVSQQLVFKAIAKTFNLDEKLVAHRFIGNWDPSTTELKSLLFSEDETYSRSQPYPFYLAYQLDVAPEELGDLNNWQIENKYDGIRGQIIVRGGEIYIWSRGEELMTEKFPEFTSLGKLLPDGTVIDGEILPFKDHKILSFAEMQKRIGRKNLSKKILDELPLVMVCYDLLELEGKDIRQYPMRERRRSLETVLKKFASPLLQLSPLLFANNAEELNRLRNKSKEMGCEGLMLKHKDSVYETGRRRGKWWKWKVDPYTIDAVLIYAQAGSGRRANLFTDYTFAVWDNGALVPFTKAYSGLTDKELKEVDAWIKKNTIEKFGPVRSVKAELVFELAFEGINLSTRHKSGVALRFPRILRWRKDKKKEEINTKADLMQLVNAL